MKNAGMIIIGNGTAAFPATQFAVVENTLEDCIDIVCVGGLNEINAIPMASYATKERCREVLQELVNAYKAGESVYILPKE